MERIYWIKFYEDGRFVSVIGQAHQSKDIAVIAMIDYLMQIQRLGFVVEKDSPESFHYDRYGTVCSVRVEED